MAAGRAEPFQAPVDHRQVGQDELEVEALDVALGVDAPVGVRIRRILEGADDVEQRVGVPQPRQVLGRQLLGPHAALARRRRCGQVDVGDVGLDDLLGLEDRGELVQALVGDLHDPHVEGQPAEASGLGVAPGERVEDGRLAAPGQTHDRDLHVAANRDTRPRSPLQERPDDLQDSIGRGQPGSMIEPGQLMELDTEGSCRAPVSLRLVLAADIASWVRALLGAVAIGSGGCVANPGRT